MKVLSAMILGLLLLQPTVGQKTDYASLSAEAEQLFESAGSDVHTGPAGPSWLIRRKVARARAAAVREVQAALSARSRARSPRP